METIGAIDKLWTDAINDNRYPVAVSMNEIVYCALCTEVYLLQPSVRDRISALPSRVRNMDILIHGDEADPTIRVLWKPHRDD